MHTKKYFNSTLKIFPPFCYLEFDDSYNQGDQWEEKPCFAIVDLNIMAWLLFLFLFRSVIPSLCLGNWWLVCLSISFSFCIFCHCLFVFTTLICLSSFDLTAHFLSLFVMTDAVEVAQTVWVVFALSGWQLPSWLFFCPRTSSSMELLFITRALHLSLSNQLNRYKDSINCQIHKLMPIHQVLRSKMKPFFPGPFVPGSHSLWVSDHSKWTKQWKLWRSWTADRKQ